MGIFGIKSADEKIREENRLKEEEIEKQKLVICAEISEREKATMKKAGVVGSSESALFDDRIKQYKFIVDDDAYVFEPVSYGVSSFHKIDMIQERSAIKPIILNKSDYSCKLQENRSIVETSDDCVGEIYVRVAPISLSFVKRWSEDEIVFNVVNTPNNLAPMIDFFIHLGIRNYFNVINLPDEIRIIRVQQGNGFLKSRAEYLIFRDKNTVTLLRHNGTSGVVTLVELDINEIQYYKSEGSIRYEQMISGSGGNENSYGGAIVGGLLFGAAGAIIGSRKNETKTEISTQTITHDTRVLLLKIERNHTVYSISLNLDSEESLDWIIPDKQYDYVLSKRREMYESL